MLRIVGLLMILGGAAGLALSVWCLMHATSQGWVAAFSLCEAINLMGAVIGAWVALDA